MARHARGFRDLTFKLHRSPASPSLTSARPHGGRAYYSATASPMRSPRSPGEPLPLQGGGFQDNRILPLFLNEKQNANSGKTNELICFAMPVLSYPERVMPAGDSSASWERLFIGT